MRNQIFFSYSHKDGKWLERFQTTLKPLVREKNVSVWDDTKIESGDLWRDEIKTALASAKVAVLLVSPDFLASDFIASDELPPLLEAAKTDGLRILWVAVRDSMYKETEIARYQAANDPSRPLASLKGSSRDSELVRICNKIKAASGADKPQAASGRGEAAAPVEGPAAPAPEAANSTPVGQDTPQEPQQKDVPREPRGVEDSAENSAPPHVALRATQAVGHLPGAPGDLLTLAEEAPTPARHGALLWQAAMMLSDMRRLVVALTVLDDLLALDGNHREALMVRGRVLYRLGRLHEAKAQMLLFVKTFGGDAEALGLLGRVYKDLWRAEWEDGKTVEERQQLALMMSDHLVEAVRSYEQSARAKLDYYNGINVVSTARLLEHLRAATGVLPVSYKVAHFSDLVSAVRLSAQTAFDAAAPDSDAGVWAMSALAELELVAGNTARARSLYRDAAYAPFATHFSVRYMLEQVRLFEGLGFRPDAVAPVEQLLRARLETLAQRAGGPTESEPRFGKVLVASGHMTDAPDRVAKGRGERFPESKVGAVRDMAARQLDKWGVGKGDLAICGGARGADIIFAELCAERGAQVWLFLPLPEGEFLDESVRLPGTDWAERFYDLKARESVQTYFQHERLGSPPKGMSVFARDNLWMINTARVEADEPKNLYAVLVWDERPTGDGPGGTSDFAERVRQLGGQLAPVINPTQL